MYETCKEFMEDYADLHASNGERLEYAHCVDANVKAPAPIKSILDNDPLIMFAIFIVVV